MESQPDAGQPQPTVNHSLSMPDLHDCAKHQSNQSTAPAEKAVNDDDGEEEEDTQMSTMVELLIEIDHDMAIFEFALISSVSRRLRTETEAEELHVRRLPLSVSLLSTNHFRPCDAVCWMLGTFLG